MSPAPLRVLLHDIPVGELSLTPSDGSEFRFYESFRARYPQPVLGQSFLDDMRSLRFTRSGVPAWFANLLPEGPLREFITERAGVAASREFFLLRHLGDDLPGAVRVVVDDNDIPDETLTTESEHEASADEDWRFSLAGVQLKFSARRAECGLTVPITGTGGDWIVKLPDQRFTEVPRVELATLRWAAAAGIPVPEAELVPIADIAGLPDAFRQQRETHALAIRRFDRPTPGTRVHIEDFAQVFDQFPAQKYGKGGYNYDTLARFILVTLGEDALYDFLHRLVFMIASGNGDAHLKNWSLIYPDGTQAKLAPAYDQVATTLFVPNDQLALNLAGRKTWADIGTGTVQHLAKRIGADPGRLQRELLRAVEMIRQAWDKGAGDFGFSTDERTQLKAHMAAIPLFAA